VPKEGIELAFVDGASGKRTDAACSGARELPFAQGYAPEDEEHCPLDELKNWFRGDEAKPQER
jgi:penicillin-binding protein 1B